MKVDEEGCLSAHPWILLLTQTMNLLSGALDIPRTVQKLSQLGNVNKTHHKGSTRQ